MRTRRNRERGQGLVEFAVVFPLFMILVFIMVDGGLVMGRYGEVNHAAKEGARYAATGADPDDVVQLIQDQSQGILDGVPAACSGAEYICVRYAPGPSSNPNDPGEVGSTVRIEVKYEYDLLTPLLNNTTTLGLLEIKSCAVARLERPTNPNGFSSANNEC